MSTESPQVQQTVKKTGKRKSESKPTGVHKRKKEYAQLPDRVVRRNERQDLLSKAKKTWESLRPKATGKEKAIALASELHILLRGRLAEIVFRHDGSRIVQWLLMTGGEETRNAVLDELLANEEAKCEESSRSAVSTEGPVKSSSLFSRLVEDRYARHLVIKVMQKADAKTRAVIFNTYIQPHVASFVRHVHSAHVLDTAYSTLLSGPGRTELVLSVLFAREPHHWERIRKSMFVDGNDVKNVTSVKYGDDFSKALSLVTKEFQSAVLESAFGVVADLIEKETLLSLEVVHAVIRECLGLAMNRGDVARSRLITSSLAPLLVHFGHTRPGFWVSTMCIKLADAKHRKKMMKSVRGHVRKLALDEFGHRMLIALHEWVDDTRLLGKLLSTELCTNERVTVDNSENVFEESVGDGKGERPVSQGKTRGGRSRAEKKIAKLKGKDSTEGAEHQSEEQEGADNDSHGNVEENDVLKRGSSKEMETKNTSTIQKSDNSTKAESEIDMDWLWTMCTHKHGRMVFLNIFFGQDTRYFNPDRYGIIWEALDATVFERTSKKDSEVRRRELRAWYTKGLCSVVRYKAGALLQDLCGCAIVVGAASHSEMSDATAAGIAELLKDDEQRNKICESGVGRRSLGAVFKVCGPKVAHAIFDSVGKEVVSKVAGLAQCENLARNMSSAIGAAVDKDAGAPESV